MTVYNHLVRSVLRWLLPHFNARGTKNPSEPGRVVAVDETQQMLYTTVTTWKMRHNLTVFLTVLESTVTHIGTKTTDHRDR